MHQPHFDEGVVAAAKRVPGRDYDATLRRWTFPGDRYEDAVRALKSAAGVSVDLKTPPEMVIRALLALHDQRVADAEKAVEETYARIPQALRDAMFPFQRQVGLRNRL